MQDYLLALTTDDHLLRCAAQVPPPQEELILARTVCVCVTWRIQNLPEFTHSSVPIQPLPPGAQRAGEPHLSASLMLNCGVRRH